MNHNNWTAALAAVITTFCLFLSSAALASSADSNVSIDLAKVPDSSELTGAMLAISGNKNIQTLSDARKATGWVRPGKDTLDAPRQHTTTWLKASLHNSSDQPLIRWLVLEPWRLNQVDAFFLSPATGETLQQNTTGLAIPLQDRSVSNGKTVIPVQLNAGEAQQLYLKIYSDSLPFISVKSWEPVSYSQHINASRIFQVALFSGIVMLLVILVLQFNVSLMVTGTWLLVAFVFEAEKNGFFSNYLLSFLENHSANLRVSAWIFTEQLFLVTSVFLLGLSKSRSWRIFLILTAIPAFIMAGLTFVLDGVSIRNLGILLTGLYATSWLFMIRPALHTRYTGQITILLLLSVYWAISAFLLVGYTFNFYYTSAFTAARIYIEIAVALALILTYSWQQKHLIKRATQALNIQRAKSRQALEQAVKDRTEDLNTALETARKASQAKVNFLGQVTHDLRSPLTSILGYAQLQAADSVSPQKATQVIQDRALYMKDLIDGLVDYARDLTENDELQDIYLIAFIDNLVNHAHIIASKQNNRFQLKIETDLPTVIRCSSKQLQRILLNLLDNAAKYTTNGRFSLSVAVTGNTNQKQSLVFRVSDTGQGIPAEQLEKIYTPFYQGSGSNPGAGLGLAICFELVDNMAGSLELESEPGKGTIATCTIPYVAGDEQLAPTCLPATQDLLPVFDAHDQRALIVEDSSQVRELLDRELTDIGFETRLFATAEAFAATANSTRKAPGVIITDYYLPDGSGCDVLRIAQAHWPGVPVVLLSAIPNNHCELGIHSSERFDACLPKPIDLLELRFTLAELCNLSPESSSEDTAYSDL
ncbi:response regulator [Marinobacter adhaerens]|uniref:histidine kinase n=1 Tax=Marinobacter adhaerens TaxID=1033846 RepID=A0A851HRJ3_9GAMM|nr:ATP-binding protein [Marinobacter adhaerens]NWN91633.1 response regulator [Marinobacter adhaerens]